jgi:hypothetical protein
VFILCLIMIIGAIVVNVLVMARMNGCDDDGGMLIEKTDQGQKFEVVTSQVEP